MGARAVSTFSLFVLLFSVAGAQSYSALRNRIEGRPPTEVIDLVRSDVKAASDDDFAMTLSLVDESGPEERKRLGENLRAMVELKALGEGGGNEAKAITTAARDIKKSPVYQDAGVEEQSNWLGRALARLRNLRFDMPDAKAGNVPNFTIGPVFVYIVWFLLGAAGLYLLVLAFRHVDWKTKLARKAKAVLEDDEPERTLDEWLVEADALAGKGLYREAVRALYLACLLRFDEHRVARFIRGETNWEHLARIQISERRPAHLDFRPATQAFDRIWYGKRVRGQEDVDQFRAWYKEITAALEAARKAA
jgi:hypothetical protein